MLYREIIAVCSQIHTKHINTLCGQNVELLNLKLVVHIVTTGLRRFNWYKSFPREASGCSTVQEMFNILRKALAQCHVDKVHYTIPVLRQSYQIHTIPL